MSKTLGAKIGFAITAFALLVSIVAYLFLDKSLAWFARNETVTARGISLSVRDDEVSCSLLSFGVLEISNGVYTFENVTDAQTGERIQSSTLPMDDPNGISYSKYSKALVLELSITVQENRHTQIRLTTPNAEVSMAQENAFSNCITVSNVSSYTQNTVTKGGTTQSFVSVGDTVTKQTSLLLYDGTLPAGETQKFYFIIEYNDLFLDHINQYILSSDVDYFQVHYRHDVTLVIT